MAFDIDGGKKRVYKGVTSIKVVSQVRWGGLFTAGRPQSPGGGSLKVWSADRTKIDGGVGKESQ